MTRVSPTIRANDLVKELQDHIAQASRTPQEIEQLDDDLFDRCKLKLPNSLERSAKDELLQSLFTALFAVSQDPSALCKLILRLIDDYSYDEIFALGPDMNTAIGLGLSYEHYHEISLTVLDKAADSVTSAESIVKGGTFLRALVGLMLAAENIKTAEIARRILVRLLKVDQVKLDSEGGTILSGGQGLVWKRMFEDREVYGEFFELTSWKGAEENLSAKRRTIAQSRLLRFVNELSWLDWRWLSRSHHRDIEDKYGCSLDMAWEPSVIDYAVLHMIHWELDDPILLNDFVDFLSNLAYSGIASRADGLSPQMTFLVNSGMHDRVLQLYYGTASLNGLSPFTIGMLYAPAASYLSLYASLHPDHLKSSGALDQAIYHVLGKLDIPASHWAHGTGPQHDLSVLTYLPIPHILPNSKEQGDRALLLHLPKPCPNEVLLSAIACIFSGNRRAAPPLHDWSAEVRRERAELIKNAENAAWELNEAQRAGARAAYFLYLEKHPSMWNNIIKMAETQALKGVALAALEIINVLIQAQWGPLPREPKPPHSHLPTEERFLDLLDRQTPHPPADSITTVLETPTLMTYLFAPPFTYVPGSNGTTTAPSTAHSSFSSGDAYDIANAKFALLKRLEARLIEPPAAETTMREMGGGGNGEAARGNGVRGPAAPTAVASGIEPRKLEEVKTRLRERIQKGVWGDVARGHSVAYVER